MPYGHSNKLVHVGKSTTVEACRGMGAAAAGRAALASWLEQGHELTRKLVGAVGAWHVCRLGVLRMERLVLHGASRLACRSMGDQTCHRRGGEVARHRGKPCVGFLVACLDDVYMEMGLAADWTCCA